MFIYFSEPVTNAGAELLFGNFTVSGNVVTGLTPISRSSTNPLAIQELVLTVQNTVTGADIMAPRTIGFSGGVNVRDLANLAINGATHRISDLVLGIPGQEPLIPILLADVTPREPDPTGGVGYITVFDGTGWIQDYGDVPLLSADFVGIGAQAAEMVWDTNIASNYYYNALWMPFYTETSFNGQVPIENLNTTTFPNTGVADPIQFGVDTSVPELDPEVMVDFYLRFTGITPELYSARLARPNDSDWYRSVCPWQFGIHRPGQQKGGVDIYKNVINPNLGERTKLHYELPRAGNVTIQVFSLAGDLVNVLFTGWLAEGKHSTTWDGRNSGGRIVARGLYFIKVVGPGIDETRKVLVVK